MAIYLTKLKKEVLLANKQLETNGLVIYTWGNVSAIDRKLGLVIIKSSEIPYDQLTKENMIVVTLQGKVVEGDLRLSSDLATHLEIYKNFPGKVIVPTKKRKS